MTDTPDTIPAEAIEAFTVACAKASTVPGATAGDCYRAGLEAVAPVIAARATAAEQERIINAARRRSRSTHGLVNDFITIADLEAITDSGADLLGGASHSAQTVSAAPGSVPKVTGPETSHHDVSVDRGATQHHPCQCQDCT